MKQRVKRTQQDHTLAFKQAAVDQVEGGELESHHAEPPTPEQRIK